MLYICIINYILNVIYIYIICCIYIIYIARHKKEGTNWLEDCFQPTSFGCYRVA